MEFEFDESIDMRSFRSAFSITPDLGSPPEISGSGKRVKIKLAGGLREATTYIVTIGASLRDLHSVSLDAPIIIAFSTGEEIDGGIIKGNVVRALNGTAAPSVDMFAFASDDSLALSEPPLYRTQTASDGSFIFRYLAESSYVVVAVQDANQNHQMDEGEKRGVAPVHMISADTTGLAPSLPWVLAVHDRSAPILERVRAITTGDLELRFSEPLDLDINHPFEAGNQDQFTFEVRDSLDESSSIVRWLYFTESKSRTIFARIDSIAPGRYTLIGSSAVSDSSGNTMAPGSWEFVVNPGLEERRSPNFLSWVPDSAMAMINTPRRIWENERFGVRFDSPVNSLQFEIQDTTGADVPMRGDRTDPGLFEFERTAFTEPFLIRLIDPPDSSVAGLFQFATDREAGALVLEARGADAELIIEVFSLENEADAVLRVVSDQESISLDGLPGGFRARLRVFVDLDGNGKWNPGSLSPYEPSEPIQWIRSDEPVRARWDTVLPDTLQFFSQPDSTLIRQ